MTNIFTIIFLFFITISYGQKNDKCEYKLSEITSTQIDSSKIVILPYKTAYDWIFKNSKPAGLTINDLQLIENILNKCISNYNSKQVLWFKELKSKHPKSNLTVDNYKIHLKIYNRQCIAVTNSNGEKEVWLNFFCDKWDHNSKTGIRMVLDGGSCYFNVKINLTLGEYYDLMVNGGA